MIDHGIRREDGWPAGGLESPCKVDILAVHEQSLVEDVAIARSQVIEGDAPVEGGATTGREDRPFVIVLTEVIQPDSTVERHPSHRPAVARRVQLATIGEEAQFAGNAAGLWIAHGAVDQLGKPRWLRLSVVVEKDDVRCCAGVDCAIERAREADVGVGSHEGRIREPWPNDGRDVFT